jgi:hypothetical protein
LMNGKQVADLAAAVYSEPAQGAPEGEVAAEAAAGNGVADTGAEDISMEEVLGSGARKLPAAKETAGEDVPQVETQTY